MIPDIFDIVAGLQDGRYTQEQAINWLNQHMQSYYDKEHDQERRLRVFEQVAFNHPGDSMENIAKQAELILSESERFASKEPTK